MNMTVKNSADGREKRGLKHLSGAVLRKAWIWAYLAAGATYIAAMLAGTGGGGGAGSLLYAAFTFASFTVIVGVGQMFVVTLGPGNVDLSIPATMTLAGTIALKFMASDGTLIVPGLLIAIGVGLACGLFNFALILMMRIPPIIATLSASFLFQSLAIWSNRGLRIKPPQSLADFATGGTFGIPNAAQVAVLVSVLAWVVLEKAIAGRWILATGQNKRAARLAGVPVNMVHFGVYVGCAVLAAFTGFILASFSGGANLNMGTEYMLMSIAVVVIGGSSIAGGNSNVPGIWAAALFMFLLVSMLNSYGLGAGVRLILTGLIIVSVVALASKRKGRV
jgi:ribose transport system permease protein